jgi:hypothetical protein
MRDSYYYKRRVVELGQERATLKIIQVDLTLDEEPALLVHDLQEYSGRDPRQKGQLVVVGADVVVPIFSHCTLHWPHTHHMYVRVCAGTNTTTKVDERGGEEAMLSNHYTSICILASYCTILAPVSHHTSSVLITISHYTESIGR